MAEPFLWLDLETTGLDDDCSVLEVAAILTDSDLNQISEPISMVVHTDGYRLAAMPEPVWTMHQSSGLVNESLESQLTVLDAEDALLRLIDTFYVADHQPSLAGSSIHFDRRFIRRLMPRLDARLHYRMVDVSTVRDLFKRWMPDWAFIETFGPKVEPAHRALADVRASIELLRTCRRLFMIPSR